MPAIDPPLSVELTEADLDRLDTLLRERALPHGGLSLEALDGFFSALIVGPDLVLPSEYLPYVWGDPAFEWDNGEQAQDALMLVTRLWNQIARRVRLDPQTDDSVFPLISLPADLPEEDSPDFEQFDFPAGADWAAGFLLGASLRGEGWDERLEQSEELTQDFEDLHALLLEDDPEDETGQTQLASDLNFRERMEILGEMPYLLNDMHLWRMQEVPQEPVRRAAGPGRNDPCPCGSGKKFKKCCGDPARLH